MKNTTNIAAVPPAAAGAATTSTNLVGDINLRVQKLDILLERRKQVTPFITDQQRRDFRTRYQEILENPGAATSHEHVRWIRHTHDHIVTFVLGPGGGC